jgi:ribosomal protein L13E
VEISKTKTDQILGSVKTLCFTSEQNKLQEIKPEEPIENISSGLTKIHVKAGHQYQLLRKIKSKGFSKNELLYAGITLKDVYHLKIHYDKRRKSSHQMNIEELKFIKNKFDNIGR